jgi:hypothetical protein
MDDLITWLRAVMLPLAIIAGVAPCALVAMIYAFWVRKTERQGRSLDSLMNGHLVASAALVGIVLAVSAIGIMIVT